MTDNAENTKNNNSNSIDNENKNKNGNENENNIDEIPKAQDNKLTGDDQEEIGKEDTENKKDKEEESKDKEDEKEKDKDKNKKEAKKLSDDLKQAKEEYDILYDKYLRINAEYDNFRKRTAKEKEGIYSDAVIDVLKNILPVIDNIERAVQYSGSANNANVSDVSNDAGSFEPEKVFEGLKMIYTQFMSSLAKIGVEEIKSVNQQFNPEVHNAVSHEVDEDKPENTITEVLQKGYAKGDKVVRPAMVKVVN